MITNEKRERNLRQQLSIAFRNAIGWGLLAVTGWYAYIHRDELTVLLGIPWYFIAALSVSLVLNGIANAGQFAVLYRTLGPAMSIYESYGLSQVTSALNQFIPGRPGGVARIAYMKHRYGTPYSQTPAILIANIVLSLFVGGILMACTNILVLLTGNKVPLILWMGVALSAFSISIFWISIPGKWISGIGRAGRMLTLFSEGWYSLRSDKVRLLQATICQLFAFAFGGLSISIAYHSLGVPLNPLIGVSIAVFIAFSNLVILTPGNLGVQEAVFGYLSMLSGAHFVEGVAASALIRTIGLVITLVFAPVAWHRLFFRRKIQIAK